MAPRAFSFPADHGPHPEFRSEWWYFTGNLAAANGRHFGFQLTFFRVALSPDAAPRESAWATNQAWMAHFALTDTEAGQFHAAERLGRGALGIAGAEASPFRVWVDDWQAASRTPDGRIPAAAQRVAWRRGGRARAYGDEAAGAAGQTRAGTARDRSPAMPRTTTPTRDSRREGSVRTRDARFEVTGTAWMDREWGTSALGPDLAGWDWLSLQLSDGRDLMLYRLRRKDGSAGAFSKGALILPDGTRIPLSVREFALKPRRWWTSPATRCALPGRVVHRDSRDAACRWKSSRASTIRSSTCRSATGRAPCMRMGALGGETVTGRGYLELAGY